MRITFGLEKEVDYEKIKLIIRETVKEELYKKEQADPLTKEDIREAVCAAIIQSEEEKDKIERERIKNTKLSFFTVATMIAFGCLSLLFFALTIFVFNTTTGIWLEKVSACSKHFLVAVSFAVMIFVEYTLGKIKDRNFIFNLISTVIAWLSMIIAVVSGG